MALGRKDAVERRQRMRRGMGIVIVLVAILVATAIGVGAYNAGLHQAVVESGRAGEVVRVIGPGYGHGLGYGFFPFGFLLFPLLFIGLFFLLGRLFWRGRWGDHPHPHGGPGPWKGGREMFDEWHRRQHEEGAGNRPGESASA
jgi:hypothetical protein